MRTRRLYWPTDAPSARPVWMLGWVSFFTATASEMVYPLLPLFLTRVLGTGALSLAVIEGVAEAANSVLKVVSGRLADRWGAPKPLVVVGYGISSAARPFIGVAATWHHVLALRFGVGSLDVSLLFGLIRTRRSPSTAFLIGAAFALAATALVYLMFSAQHETHTRDE